MKKLILALCVFSGMAFADEIPAVLNSNINCGINGIVIGVISKQVTIDNTKIPQGTKILGTQDKCFAKWQKVTLPDGSSMNLEKLTATSQLAPTIDQTVVIKAGKEFIINITG